eukprot:214097-Alexandrium_andersonii.AAC.1
MPTCACTHVLLAHARACVRRLSEPEAMFYIYDLIVGLKYLHRRRVIHRDLKLGNLFLDSDVRLKALLACDERRGRGKPRARRARQKGRRSVGWE